VRRLATAAALLCVLGLPAAASASSGARGKPFDFELAPAAPTASTARVGPVVSPALRTAHRFNLVGMRWRGGGEPSISVRVRRAGHGWSRWASLAAHADHNPDPRTGERLAAASDPLWVGSAEAIQYRLGHAVPGLRLHFVNVGRYAHSRIRAAQDPQPDFVSRAEWGASACPPRQRPDYGTVKAVIVHHTVSLNDYTPDEAPAIVLAICRYHRNSNGWNDIGYNALVDKYGVLYEGRAGGLDLPVVGAQAQGFNSSTAGIASIGDHTQVEATPATLSAIARYARWRLQMAGQPLTGAVTLTSSGGPESRYGAGVEVREQRVLGHRDVGKTACPGALLFGQLDDIRTMVATGVGLATTPTARVSATLAHYTVDYGETVPLSGSLADPDGLPLAAAPVDVQTNSDGRWVTSAELTTASDGSFTGVLSPRKRMYVRFRFPGSVTVPGSVSSRLLLRLRPVIELRHPASRGRRGHRVSVSGSVGPRKRVVWVVLQQRIHGRFRQVGAKAVRTRSGRFATSFVPAFRATYRYAVVAKSDDDTDRGTTGWKTLRVSG
jgi:N-acetylmuramoyl-L-alanine amidase